MASSCVHVWATERALCVCAWVWLGVTVCVCKRNLSKSLAAATEAASWSGIRDTAIAAMDGIDVINLVALKAAKIV